MTQEEFFKRFTYSIRTDKIGGGAFGTVYRAFDEVLNREVAIKVSEVKIMGGKEFSLKDEFDAIKDLPAHRNIANYEELFTFESPQGIFDYAVMQFYKDGNLSEFIKSNPSTALKEEVVIDLLNGIIHLHKHNVVHRDLKPGNILVFKRGEKVIPVITDFGLSKQTEKEGQSRFSNSFGGGTLKYSSPEQLKAEKLRLNTDLWAYGVIVHEIFTGKNLFMAHNITGASAEAEKEIYEQIIGTDISEMLNDLPEKWKLVVSQCLVRDGAKRIKSATALKELILNGKSSPKEKEPFIEDKTIISNNEPAEFLDDKTVIDDSKQKANKPISEKPKEFKSRFAYDYKAEEKRKKQTLIGVGITAIAIVIAVLSYLLIPNKSNAVWELAQSVNTINSYESFISQNPESEFVLMAKDHIAWLGALESNSTAAYEKYLLEFPEGNYVVLAKDNKSWLTALSINNIESYQTYIDNFKKGQFVDLANSNILELKDDATNLTKQKEKAANDKLDLDAWNKAKKGNRLQSYNLYLSSFAQGNNKAEAKKAISDLNNLDKIIADEIASFGSDNEWVNKIISDKTSSAFIKAEFEKAKNYKSEQGKARLAYFYLEGLGIKRNYKADFKKAENLSLVGSKSKIPLACYVYAMSKYSWDSGEAAYFNLLKICDGKLDIADYALGYMYLSKYTDEGTPYDPKLGLKYYEDYYKKFSTINKEEASKVAESIYTAYWTGHGNQIQKDKELQLQWLKKSYSIFPNGSAAFSIADFYLGNYKNPKYKISNVELGKWYQRSADLGYGAGMNMVANFYIKGQLGFSKDRESAIKWYKRAADTGSKSAIKDLKELGVNYTPKK